MTHDPALRAACELRDALLVTMDACGAPPCRISLSPTSAPTIDICCECGEGDGQAWVAMIQAEPIFSQAAGFTPCGYETEVLFVVGISRCAHTVDDRGEPPSGAELDEDSLKLYRDRRIMRQAIALWATEMALDKNDYKIGIYDVHPLRGGCLVSTSEVWYRYMCEPDPCGPCNQEA